ncbi:hypothetical protein OHB24_35975 [Kribbella sp. NBC_00482]|uniref:hypothetical protein n=1 Tax=Kribbella sp. NBC_00482 TaxID=2975968 RepID=UPI002E16E1CB
MRIASLLVAGAIGVSGLVAAGTAATAADGPDVPEGPGFAIKSQNGGEFAGHAEAGGRIAWHGAKSFTIHVARVADICLSGGDGAGAYIWYQTRLGNGFSDWKRTPIADTSGCSDGDVGHGDYRVYSNETIGAVRVILRECEGKDGCNTSPNDNAKTDWKWNPNR